MARSVLAYGHLYAALQDLKRAYSVQPKATASNADLRAGDQWLVAAHAAMEFFFEELCRRALHASLRRFSFDGRKSPLLDSLVSCHYWRTVSALPKGALTRGSIVEQVAAASKWYVGQRIDINQGIKEANLHSLVLPLGFDLADFDPVWVAEMNWLGRTRGDVAHGKPTQNTTPAAVQLSSTTTAVVWTPRYTQARQGITPWDIEGRIARVLPELREWDRRIDKRCR